KECTGNLKNFTKSLYSIGRKLDTGQGTAGKLINDPAIFDAANHLVIGIDESKLLRWLIRNRQRSGIQKPCTREGGPASLPEEPAAPASPTPAAQTTRPPG